MVVFWYIYLHLCIPFGARISIRTCGKQTTAFILVLASYYEDTWKSILVLCSYYLSKTLTRTQQDFTRNYIFFDCTKTLNWSVVYF
ncbi:hypothetical protein SUGI_0011950 [Cryptomeria japonica]|nr:hypothetical protein SUGI_0011950 [Cryptomeria japonica]